MDANESALNAIGLAVTRPINDWCSDGEFYDPATGLCPDGTDHWGPRWAESWDDWGPFYTPMYSQLVGLNGSTVEMCNSTGTGCSVPGTTLPFPRGRVGARTAQYTVATSTLTYDIANRVELMNDQIEVYRRGVTDAPRPATADLPPGFDNSENNWMHEYPQAYVIPVGGTQRSDAEAHRLVGWLMENGVRVRQLAEPYQYDSNRIEPGSFVVFMDQALRGLADTALGAGVDISSRISILYAPPGAWSHGYLWGADVLTIPDDLKFKPVTERLLAAPRAQGGVLGSGTAFALELDSASAVRTANAVLAGGATAELATASFASASGRELPAGTVLFPASARAALESAAAASGVWAYGVGTLPAREAIDHSPRIAVLTAAVNQDVWVLRNLGFRADPIATGNTSALNNPTSPNPLTGYDLVFNTAAWPAGTTARARLTAFFAGGGGYLGANANGANFLTAAGQVTGLTAASRGGNGRSGIIYWDNSAPGTSPITGAYRSRDTAIVDPPTWFTAVPSTMTVDGSLPFTGFFLSGLWLLDAQSASAPGSAMIAHGTNTAGTARITSFALNPLYRADPEREWPMIASAALWVDQ